MAKSEYLGEFEHVVLLTILRLGDGAYGAMIRAEIERVTGRSPAKVHRWWFLEAGLLADSTAWRLVQPAVSRNT